MTLLLAALFALTAQTTPLDLNQVANRIAQEKTYTGLIHLIENEMGYAEEGKNKISYTIKRSLGDHFEHIRLEFSTENDGVYFHLSIVKNDDKLIYFELSDGEKKKKKVIDKQELAAFLDYFNSIFGASKKEKDFKNEIDKNLFFSDACGFSAEPTNEWNQMEAYVEKQKIDKIRAFLCSLDVESQAYGLIGMIKLQKQGVVLTEKDLQIMAYLRKRNSGVVTCLGCSFGAIIGMNELTNRWE
jgi:hypothetical protein